MDLYTFIYPDEITLFADIFGNTSEVKEKYWPINMSSVYDGDVFLCREIA